LPDQKGLALQAMFFFGKTSETDEEAEQSSSDKHICLQMLSSLLSSRLPSTKKFRRNTFQHITWTHSHAFHKVFKRKVNWKIKNKANH
jgi:hypothetical protein